MKIIRKEDLMIVLEHSERETFRSDQLCDILSLFGDEWYVRDGKLQKTMSNVRMEQLRKEHESKQTSFWDDAMAIMNDMTNAQVEEAIKYLESRRNRKAVSNACEAMCWED